MRWAGPASCGEGGGGVQVRARGSRAAQSGGIARCRPGRGCAVEPRWWAGVIVCRVGGAPPHGGGLGGAQERGRWLRFGCLCGGACLCTWRVSIFAMAGLDFCRVRQLLCGLCVCWLRRGIAAFDRVRFLCCLLVARCCPYVAGRWWVHSMWSREFGCGGWGLRGLGCVCSMWWLCGGAFWCLAGRGTCALGFADTMPTCAVDACGGWKCAHIRVWVWSSRTRTELQRQAAPREACAHDMIIHEREPCKLMSPPADADPGHSSVSAPASINNACTDPIH